jgi:dUTP pyrophosphatase
MPCIQNFIFLLKVPYGTVNWPVIRFVKRSSNVTTPTRGSAGAAGFDLYIACDEVVTARGTALISTDLQIQLPDDCYGRIVPRSGLALHHHIGVGAGVVDADYRGDLSIVLFKNSDTAFTLSCGDRIAQLVCGNICDPELKEETE